MAWGDTLLDNLRPKLRALFAAGHFTDVIDGTAQFALPNEAHCERCQPFRADVQKVLSTHFDRPVTLELVVENAATSDSSATSSAAGDATATKATTAEREEESIDMNALEDAGSASTGVDQLAEVFGAVDLVEETEEGSS